MTTCESDSSSDSSDMYSTLSCFQRDSSVLHNTNEGLSYFCVKRVKVVSSREEPQHTHKQPPLPARPHKASRRSGKSHNTYTSSHPCRPDRTRQVAGQGRATTHTSSHPCRPDRTRQVTGQGRATTHTQAATPAGQTAQGKSPVREEPQHTHKQPPLPARPHKASRRSGKSHITHTHTHTSSHPCRPDRTRQVAGQGRAKSHTHTQTSSHPCRPDRTRQVAGQGRATTHTSRHPCRPDRTRQVAGQGRATTHTQAASPAGQTAQGKSPVREEPHHTHTHKQPPLPARPHKASRRARKSHNTHTSCHPCRPDRTRQVAGQGRATTQAQRQQTLPARSHSAGRRSGTQHTYTYINVCTVHVKVKHSLSTKPHCAGRQSATYNIHM